MFNARPLEVCRGVPKALHAAHIGIEPFLALRLQEALADVIVGAGAPQVLSPTYPVPIGNSFAAAPLDCTSFPGPFLKPCIVVTDAVFESQSNTIDLADFCAAPWRHIEPN